MYMIHLFKCKCYTFALRFKFCPIREIIYLYISTVHKIYYEKAYYAYGMNQMWIIIQIIKCSSISHIAYDVIV